MTIPPILVSLSSTIMIIIKGIYESLSAMSLVTCLLSKEKRNFFRVGQGLHCTAMGLHGVVKQGIETMHNNIKAKLTALPPCPGKCKVTCPTCLSWKREIELEFKSHYVPRNGSWQNADSQNWPSNRWEMAKVFSPTMLTSQAVTNSETDFDLTSLSNILLNCDKFAAIDTRLVKDLKKIRNKLDAHNSTQKVTDADTAMAFQSMANLLKDPSIIVTKNGKQALKAIEKLENPNHIFTICCVVLVLLCSLGFGLYLMPSWVWILAQVQFYTYWEPVHKDVSQYGCPIEDKWIPHSSQEFKFQHAFERHKEFVGRDWLFNNVSKSLSTKRAVLVEGPMGIGKSAFVAAAVCQFSEAAKETFPNVLAYHKCQFDDSKTQDPVRFIRNMADMIARRWPQYAFYIYYNEFIRKQLSYEECLKDVSTCFDQVILNAFTQLGPLPTTHTIIIDALDECITDQFQGETITRLIEKKLNFFPSWIKIVGTTRNSDCHEAGFYHWTKVHLEAKDHKNLQDLQDFVQNLRINSCFSVQFGNSSSLLRMSKGYFLHLKEILKEVDAPGWKADITIEGIYLANFERVWGKKGEFFRIVKYCLEIMLASNRPTSDETLFEYLHETRKIDLKFEDFIKDTHNLTLIMSKDNEFNWRFNHQHITYWLTAQHRRGHVFYINAQNGHQVIAEYYIQQAEDQTSSVDIVDMAYHIHKANNKTLEKRFKRLPSNYIRLTGGLFENGWSVRSPKVVELALFHLENNTGIKDALFWSVVYGHKNTIVSLLENGGEIAQNSLFENDYIIPFYKSGTLTELAHQFNPEVAETIQLIQLVVQYWQKAKPHFRNSNISSSAFIRTYLSSFSDIDCLKKAVQTKRYQNYEIWFKDIAQVDIIRKRSYGGENRKIMSQFDKKAILCFAISTNNIDLARLILEKWEDKPEKYFYTSILEKGITYTKKHIMQFVQQNTFTFHLAILLGNTKMVSTLLDIENMGPYLLCGVHEDRTTTVLHLAVLGGHDRILKILLDKYPDLVEEKDTHFNMTALQIAIINNKTECLKVLLGKGADITVKYLYNNSALHLAYQIGNLEMIKMILQQAPGLVEGLNDYGLKPSQHAFANGHVKILQDTGVSPNVTEKNALVLAVSSGCEDVVDFVFQENNSNPWWLGKSRIKSDLSVLHVAAINGDVTSIKKILQVFPELMNFALRSKMNATHIGNYYTSFYTWDILEQVLQLSEIIPFKKENVIQVLQQMKAHPTDNNRVPDNCDVSSLIGGIVDKFAGTIRLKHLSPIYETSLKSQWRLNHTWDYLAIDIFEANKFQDKPWKMMNLLHIIWTKLVIEIHNFCAEYTLVCFKETFTSSRKFVYFADLYQNACEYVVKELSHSMAVTPLDIALALNHTNASLALIQAGAAMNLSDVQAHRSYRIALEQGNLETMHALNDSMIWKNTTIDPFMWDLTSHLHAAAYRGKVEVVKYFMSSLSGQSDAKVLLIATFGGDVDTVLYLIHSGIKVETVCKELGSQRICLNALHIAAMRNFVDILKILLVHFPRAVDIFSEPSPMSALDFAMAYNQTEASIELLKSERKVEKVSHALMVAIRSGNLALVREIIEKGSVGKWNLYVAIFYGNLEIMKMIEYGTGIINDKMRLQLLYMAILSGRIESVRYILPNISTNDVTEDMIATLEMILNMGTVPPEIKFLAEAYLSLLSYSPIHKMNPLQVCAYFGYTQIVELLLGYFPLDPRDFCYEDHIPLEVAILRNHTETAILLIKTCSEENIHPGSLTWEMFAEDISAAFKNLNLEIVKYFLKVYPRIASFEGFHFMAAKHGCLEILIEISKHSSLDDGKTLCSAVMLNHMHIVDFLLSLNVSNFNCAPPSESCDLSNWKKSIDPSLLNELEAIYGPLVIKSLQIGSDEKQVPGQNNALFTALTLNRTEMFFKLLKHKNLIEGKDKAINTANKHLYLGRGLKTGNVMLVSNILSQSPEMLNFIDSCGATLGELAAGSSTEMLKMVSNVKDLDDGKTLCAAVSNNKTENVKYLIKQGVTNTSCKVGRMPKDSTVLDIALCENHAEIVTILVEHFPSLTCNHKKEFNTFYVDLFAKAISNQSDEFLTPLRQAKLLNCISKANASFLLIGAIVLDDTRTMEYILSEIPDIAFHVIDLNEGVPPIDTAAQSVSLTGLKVFSKYVSLDNGNFLCYAVLNSNIENVLFLLQYGVQNTSCVTINREVSDYISVLHAALLNMNPHIILMILKHFPNLIHEGKSVTPTQTLLLDSLRSSSLSNNVELMNLLTKLGFFTNISVENVLLKLFSVMDKIETPEQFAFKNDSEEVTYVSMLLKNKPEVVAVLKSQGINLCNWAAANASTEMLRVVAGHFEVDDGTTLPLAVQANRVKNVKYLLANGVRNVWNCLPNSICTTILSLPVFSQNVKMTKSLAEHFVTYIDVFPKDGDNKPIRNTHTPLSLAVSLNYTEIAHVLMQAGANAVVPTKHGINPLSNAIVNKNYYIAAMLLSKFPELKTFKNIFRALPRQFAQTSDVLLYSSMKS